MLRFVAPLWVGLLVTASGLIGQPAGVWLDVPFVRQEKNGCGAASVAMVMRYWQHQQGKQLAADPDDIQHALYSRVAQGIYASDMKRYFDQRGYRTFAFAGAWADLKEHLDKGRPLIVALKPPRSRLHYVVVAGLDWQQDVIFKNDPAERKLLKQGRSDFEKEWKAAGNWTLLAVPREDHGSPP